ncbi:MAG: methyltransferase domain-containing protein [Thermomicrobiales bacterium]|nr:methyltransferase domain-containing protein [Thermomicrobiales bacterium]
MAKRVDYSLEELLEKLSPDDYYQSPGGRRTLLAYALIAGIPQGARVLDVQCGIGSSAVDIAESFGATVYGFDDYPAYLAFGRQLANNRGLSKQIDFQAVSGAKAVESYPAGEFDLVLGLGGGLSDTIPGGFEGGLAAAHRWLKPKGVVITGDLIAPGKPSDLMKMVFGQKLHAEDDYLAAIDKAGFDVIYASRSTTRDWEKVSTTMDNLRARSLDLGPEDERLRQRLTEAARTHPEVAFLNVVARKR